MKLPITTIAFLSFCFSARSQTTVCINDGNTYGADASLGYHDNYDTDLNNYGTDLYIKAFCIPGNSGGENTNRAVFVFNTSFLPVNTQVIQASVTLHAAGYVNNLLPGHFGNNAARLYRITSSWQENTVTWNTQPSFSSADFSDVPQSSNSNQDYTIDVTPIASFHVQNPQQNFGYLLRLNQENPNDAAALAFYSSDVAGIAEWPELCITYVDENDTITTSVLSLPELPNVLTVNDDDINDEYQLPAGIFQSFRVIICNRWGQEVYSNSGENGLLFWNGKTSSDLPCNEGVYFYIFEAVLNDGQAFKKSGIVELID